MEAAQMSTDGGVSSVWKAGIPAKYGVLGVFSHKNLRKPVEIGLFALT
jgi:hypothetical protein